MDGRRKMSKIKAIERLVKRNIELETLIKYHVQEENRWAQIQGLFDTKVVTHLVAQVVANEFHAKVQPNKSVLTQGFKTGTVIDGVRMAENINVFHIEYNRVGLLCLPLVKMGGVFVNFGDEAFAFQFRFTVISGSVGVFGTLYAEHNKKLLFQPNSIIVPVKSAQVLPFCNWLRKIKLNTEIQPKYE